MTTDPARAACAGLPDIFESTTLFDHRIAVRYCLSDDKRRAGRHAHGSRQAGTHLTDEDVRTIVRRYRAGGVTQASLAAEYGVNQSEVSRMVNGKSWQHLWHNPDHPRPEAS